MKTILTSFFSIITLMSIALFSHNVTAQDKLQSTMQKDESLTQPQFPGGMQKFTTYIEKHFKIPKNIKGQMKVKILISFIVEKDGSMSNINIENDPGYGLGDEAVRVLKKLNKKWNPGMKDGIPVIARYTFPITITIDNP